MPSRKARSRSAPTSRAAASRATDDGIAWAGTRPLGCLLVHGFTATPEEVRPLGDALAARGFACHAVRLPGHGTSIDDLARVRGADWMATVEGGARALATTSGTVAIVGMSMGALLALRVAVERRTDIAALVLCATPFVLADTRATWLRWVHRLPGVARRFAVIPKVGRRDIADPDARARSEAYDAMPLGAVLELMRLRAAARRALGRVTQPTLVLHGRHDRNAPVANVDYVRRRLGTSWIETRIFERSAHVLTEDFERDAVAASVADFLERVASRSG